MNCELMGHEGEDEPAVACHSCVARHNEAYVEACLGMNEARAEVSRLQRQVFFHAGNCDVLEREREAARRAARALWLMWSYREKEARDKELTEWLKANCPWLEEESE